VCGGEGQLKVERWGGGVDELTKKATLKEVPIVSTVVYIYSTSAMFPLLATLSRLLLYLHLLRRTQSILLTTHNTSEKHTLLKTWAVTATLEAIFPIIDPIGYYIPLYSEIKAIMYIYIYLVGSEVGSGWVETLYNNKNGEGGITHVRNKSTINQTNSMVLPHKCCNVVRTTETELVGISLYND